MIFAGLLCSAVADTVALGSILIPMMKENGYDEEDSVGLVSDGAIIGPIIPPSIPMIVLGVTVGTSIIRMFMSGIVPGVIIGLELMFTWFLKVRQRGYNDIRKYTKEEVKRTTLNSLPALVMPVIIVGEIQCFLGFIFYPGLSSGSKMRAKNQNNFLVANFRLGTVA